MVLNIISIIIAFAGLVISLIFSLISTLNNKRNGQRNAEVQSKVQKQKEEWEAYKKQQDKIIEKIETERNKILENRLLEFTSKFDIFIQSYAYWNKINQDANANLNVQAFNEQVVENFDNAFAKFETEKTIKKEKTKGEVSDEKQK